MIIGGLQKFSLIDYPGQISSIIFTRGCNFDCVYCHNKELISTKEHSSIITPEQILAFLGQRQKKIDAVVITGGEPTLQPDLIKFMKKIKQPGFLIKLDTNGSNPEILQEAIKTGIVDYIAMDIKAPLESYSEIVRKKIDTQKIQQSINIIQNSQLSHEFRTTVLKSLLSKSDIIKIRELVKGSKLVLQKYTPSKGLDIEPGKQENYSDEEFSGLLEILRTQGSECILR